MFPFVYAAPWGNFLVKDNEYADPITAQDLARVQETGEARVVRAWECWDCGGCTRDDYYMVHDHLWDSAGVPEITMLHRKCLEKRLGRPLNADDFTTETINASVVEEYA